jgi:hypothetical protein
MSSIRLSHFINTMLFELIDLFFRFASRVYIPSSGRFDT